MQVLVGERSQWESAETQWTSALEWVSEYQSGLTQHNCSIALSQAVQLHELVLTQYPASISRNTIAIVQHPATVSMHIKRDDNLTPEWVSVPSEWKSEEAQFYGVVISNKGIELVQHDARLVGGPVDIQPTQFTLTQHAPRYVLTVGKAPVNGWTFSDQYQWLSSEEWLGAEGLVISQFKAKAFVEAKFSASLQTLVITQHEALVRLVRYPSIVLSTPFSSVISFISPVV